MKTTRIITLAAAALAAAPLFAQAQIQDKVKVSGYMDLDYYRGDNGNADTVVEQEFIIRRARLNFDVKLNDMLSGRVNLQGDTSSSTGARVSTLKYLYADFKLHPMAKVRAGLFKYQFDIEGLESTTKRWFMNRAVVVNSVVGGLNGSGGDFADKGVMVSGGSEVLGYGLGLFQGNGSESRDTNSKFGYTANVRGKLGPVQLNAGYLATDNTPQGTSTTNKYDAYTLGAAYASGPFVARTEFYRGSLTATTLGVTSAQDRSGYYVMAGYSITPEVDLMARYQQFENESWTTSNNRVNSFDVGMKYHIVRKGKYGDANISLNYMQRDAGANVTQKIFDERGANVVGGNIGNVVMTRLEVTF